MRKKLGTRFPASRIKKIMQADEDVGKIAMAVPLLVSKALELFLQDLCDRTYEITLQRGVKTISSLHLNEPTPITVYSVPLITIRKQCVQSFSVFDFLKEIVSKVPDLGSSDAGGEEKHRRRRAVDDEDDSEEELKRTRTQDTPHSSGRGHGRGRGRGRGRGKASDRDNAHFEKCEDEVDLPPENGDKPKGSDDGLQCKEPKDSVLSCSTNNPAVRNFDLNMDLDENGNTSAVAKSASTSVSVATKPDLKHEEYPGWSMSDMKRINPLLLAQLDHHAEEDEEDDDNEEG